MTTFATLEQNIRQALYDILNPVLVTGGPAGALYKYRTDGGSRLSRIVAMTVTGIDPTGAVTAGTAGVVEVGFAILAEYGNNETEKEAAENDVAQITGLIIDELDRREHQRNDYWRAIEFLGGSRPSNPPNLPNTRYADFFIRVHLI